MGSRYLAFEGPCVEVVARLRAAGRPELAALLSEMLPSGEVVDTDEGRPELVRRLTLVAEDVTLDDVVRAQTRRLARIGADLPSVIAGHGTVWIAWWVDEGPPWAPDLATTDGYMLSWQGHGDDRDLLEDGPLTAELGEALVWGRRRSPRVIVRPSWDPGVHYWAGEGPPPADDRGPMPVLPGSESEP